VAQPALEPGDEIGGYRLGEVLGAGGLGRVHATSGPAGEALAIKIVAHGLDPTVRRRVAREVEALRLLDHPNVLRLVDAGATEAWSYLVMPRLAGVTLRELAAGGPLTPESAALLVLHAARGVGAIHRAGLTHRDLKPDNVMLTDDGRVVIIDLGLALAPDWTRQTTEGSIAGSLPYMAPEQIEGDAAPASDVWALGVTWWELVTARRPFARGRAIEEVAAIAAGTRPAIGEVDRRIGDDAAALIERCLDRDPARRPADGDTLAAALAPIAEAGLAGVAAAAALVRLSRDRVARDAEVAAAIARGCAARARELAAAGDVFAAMRAVDRGLAYRPDDAELAAVLATIMPGGAPSARSPAPAPADPIAPTAVATPVSPPRRRRRWPWLAAGGAIAAAGTAIAIAVGGQDAPARFDYTEPAAVLEALIHAARTGDVRELPGLCLDREGTDEVRAICAITPFAQRWPEFRTAFHDATIEGVYRTEDGAYVMVRLAPDSPRPVTVDLLRRRGRFYLKAF
jgi:hypothetical protein